MNPAEDDPRPAEPVQPDLDACCGSGCEPCIFDIYDEQRTQYVEALRAWRLREAARQAASPAPTPAGVNGAAPPDAP